MASAAERAALLEKDVQDAVPDLEAGVASGSDTPPECRICRSGSGELLRACRCAARVHASCLEAWQSARAAATFPLARAAALRECEVCGSPTTIPTEAGRGKSLWARARDAMHSLECWGALLLLALAVCGHGLFLSRVLRGPELAGPRALLALGNAAATAALCALALRVGVKCARAGSLPAALAAALPAERPEEEEAARPPMHLKQQVALGAGLSVVAALQVFLLLTAV